MSLVKLTVPASGGVLSSTIGAVGGLQGDTKLVGIDSRIQDGGIYGVGDAGGVYLISRVSGAATKSSQLTVPLLGTEFGVDFNPAANRLRVVSNVGQNLRHNIDDATAPRVTARDGVLCPSEAAVAAGDQCDLRCVRHAVNCARARRRGKGIGYPGIGGPPHRLR